MSADTERFWAKVAKSDGCWLWTGRIHRSGYGVISLRGRQGTTFYVHRIAYELAVGPIPEGLTLDHLCHNEDDACHGGFTCLHRRCVNPAHLEPVTMHVNMLRGENFCAKNARKTHCPQGHPYSLENTLVSRGRRTCKTCQNAALRARRARLRAA